jgi:hypothetical protein
MDELIQKHEMSLHTTHPRLRRDWFTVHSSQFMVFVGRGNKRVSIVFECKFMRIIHRDYRKRINSCYVLEQSAINFEIPLSPPFSKGETDFPPLWKRGVRGDSYECASRTLRDEHTHFIELMYLH